MPATVRSRGSRTTGSDVDPGTPKPRNDAYVGLLLISLLAQIAGAVFLYLELNSYPESKKPPTPPAAPTKQYQAMQAPGAGGGQPGLPPAPPPGAPPAPPPGPANPAAPPAEAPVKP